MCCCGVLYALTPPRGSASPPLSLSTSQDLRPPPRESISQENCPPSLAPPQPSTSTPSLKVIHSLSVDTSCCLLRPGFWFGGDRGLPDISSQNFRQNSSSLGDLAAKGAQARWRPSVPSVPFDSDSDHRRPIEECDERADRIQDSTPRAGTTWCSLPGRVPPCRWRRWRLRYST